MGYSPQKKQLDLKEFLSQPAKQRPGKGFGFRRGPTKPAQSTEQAAAQSDKPKE